MPNDHWVSASVLKIPSDILVMPYGNQKATINHESRRNAEENRPIFAVNPVPANGVAPLGVRVFADTVLTKFGNWMNRQT